MRNIYFLLIVFFLILTQRISFAIDNIVINGLFKDKVVVTIDGKQRILKKNKLTADGLRLIKANSKEATIEINGTSKIFTLDEKIVSTFSEGKHTPLIIVKKVKIKADNSGQYVKQGKINGKLVEFLVDTGATYVSINSNLAKQLRIKYEDGKQLIMETAMGQDTAYEVTLKSVKIGDIELRNVTGIVSDKMTDTVLLGMSFLGKLKVKSEEMTFLVILYLSFCLKQRQ